MSNRRKQDKRKRLSRVRSKPHRERAESEASSSATSGLTTVEARAGDLQAVERMPLDPQKRKALRESRRIDLGLMFEGTLSQGDRELWHRWEKLGAASIDNKDVLRICGKFDDFILRIGRTLGWQLFLSDAVVSRIAQWWHIEKNGPQLLERLGKELALGARVCRGWAALPMDDTGWYEAKRQAKRELRPLLNRIRNTFAQRNRAPRMVEICSFVRGEIEHEPGAFSFLSQSLRSLLGFLQHLESSGAAMAGRLASVGVRPAEFFDSWGAWSTNRQEESFRQKISEFGSQETKP